MKKVLSVFAFCAISAMAADLTGYIVDASCAGKKEDKGAMKIMLPVRHAASRAELRRFW